MSVGWTGVGRRRGSVRLGLPQDLRQLVERCVKCGACLSVCPLYAEDRSEASGTRGKMGILEAMADRSVQPSREIAEVLSLCLACLSCTSRCPSGVELQKILPRARGLVGHQDLTGRATQKLLRLLGRHSALSALAWALAPSQSLLFSRLPAESGLRAKLPLPGIPRGRVLPQLRRTPFRAAAPERVKVADALGEVALFTGCATEFLYPEVGQATVNLLASSGWQVWIPPLQTCCGFPSLSSGDSETAESCLEKNQRALQGWSGTAVVVVCATCGSRLKEALGSCGQTVVDATELLVRSLDRGRLPRPATGAGGDLPVTYHEACHLVRGQGLSQGPRELLKWAAPGGFVELEEADRCCGFGGVFSAKHYARSRAVGQRKVEKVLRSGARTLVAECPGCVMHLRDMLQGLRVPVRTVHLMEFLDRRLRGGAG